MAEQSPSTPSKTSTTTTMGEPNSIQSEPENKEPHPDPSSSLPQQSSTPPPNLTNPTSIVPPQPAPLLAPPSIPTYAGGAVVPSFRPATQTVVQFSALPPNPSLPQPMSYLPPASGPLSVPPPGVVLPPPPPNVSVAGQVPLGSSVSPVVQTLPYAQPGQPIRAPFAPMPNGYPMPQTAPPGSVPPPGILRYPTPYSPMIRPAYPSRPVVHGGVIPPLPRPPILGLRPPIVPPVVRPPVPNVAAPEKQTTVYVGKIAPSVENDFILALLQLCGPVKSWKRPQNPTDGTFKGFGFCEFDSAEGVLRALRLLCKLNIDGQELMLKVNQATQEYLEQFVEKKKEGLKNKEVGAETETENNKMDEVGGSGDKKIETASVELPKPVTEESAKDGNETTDKENSDASSFGVVNDEDRQADKEALEKLTEMMEERLKNKPLPPPPPHPSAPGSSNLEGPAKPRDGEMDIDGKEPAHANETNSESKPSGEQDRSETSSPDRDRRLDRKGRDRERDMKREKERELERYEREREQERAKREKEREYRLRDDERRFKAREKEWESREKEKEHWRQREKEREKERAKARREEILAHERETDGGYSKKRKYRSSDEERRRIQREKDEDLADRVKEEEEVAAEAERRRAEEEQKRKQQEELKLLSGSRPNGNVLPEENNLRSNDMDVDEQASRCNLGAGAGDIQNGSGDEIMNASLSATDGRQNSSVPAKKLGFGLQGSGKKASVPSVFNQDEDEDMQKLKKMRPLVPIDYSTEEQLAIQPSTSEAMVDTELARRVSSSTQKDDRADKDKDRSSRRLNDRSGLRDRERSSDEVTRNRVESRKESLDHDRPRDSGVDKVKTNDNQKLLDAKQLIDMIPKTKDELFSYAINWATYDQNALDERMKPWISKKITEFLGEEEPSLVDYIMSSTREHVAAAEMLDRLQGILDDEAEMFVLKMWRMLIFEIKKVETGLALRTRA
ncbi:OLC1v1028256C1 [Oldenlandia corymbosa var. corymbosa]|uniref:OLC1v1028256C1 n=1 Tax=Oldenlandia corymbosa var. corymbosa TaxID=529605 RepID=A0AAV1CCH5_OLDCO|nr:OLC1v1028256C1 [Oldenlandia corymbosa var. corymbosa]